MTLILLLNWPQRHAVDRTAQPRGQEAGAADHATQWARGQVPLDPTTRWARRYCRCCGSCYPMG
jgi:hypothetical protein